MSDLSSSLYGQFVKPGVDELLSALRLNVIYHRAVGDTMYYHNEAGEEVPVLDLAGGMGATILGHNHPEIKEEKLRCLNSDICTHAQGSVREDAGRLAAELNEHYPGKEKRIVIFTNSGTETIEAALKHTEFNRVMRLLETAKSIHRNVMEVREFYRLNSATPIPKEFRQAGFDFLCTDILHQINDIAVLRPIIIAAERSFHGKTSGSVRVTGNPLYREAFERLSAIDARFVEFNNVRDIERILEDGYRTIRKLAVTENGIEIVEENFMNVAAFIMEPVQGEGGIHIASHEFMRGVERLRAKYGFEWILDEIQSGIGRTGRLFAVEHFGIDKDAIDYVVLSKALGGGKDKVGALMIRESIHDPRFGILHTSTFAEDNESARMGLKTLEILTRKNGRLLRAVGAKGRYLVRALNRLKDKYPTVIKDVRGKGLLIGVEFQHQDNNSSLFFNKSVAQGALGVLLSGYMLREHRIRTAPPLNSLVSQKPSNIIRIEPSAYISRADMDHVIAALDRACEIIIKANAFEFSKYIVGRETPGRHDAVRNFAVPYAPPKDDPAFRDARRMAFLIHPLDIHQVVEDFDPSLQLLAPEPDAAGKSERERYWDAIVPLLDSFVFRRVNVRSPRTGDRVHAMFIGFLYTTKQMAELRKTNPKLLISGVQKAVDLGARLGADICGLGAFTSIVTHNGTDLDDTYIRVTSGNSYTSALIWQSILKAAEYTGKELCKCTCAVVGAAGNIGRVTASLMAESIPRVILIGREKQDSLKELRDVAATIYADTVDTIRTTRPENLKGIAGAIATDLLLPYAVLNSKEYRFNEKKTHAYIEENFTGKARTIGHLIESVFNQRPADDIGWKILEAIQVKHGVDPYIIQTVDAKKYVPEADILISAVSADTAIIDTAWIKPGAIVNDVSLPPSISLSIYRDRTDVLAIQGGIGHLPEYIDLGIPGLAVGATLGCMAETFILTMMNMIDNYSFGNINKQQVVKIWEAGNILGFGLAAIKYQDTKLTREVARQITQRAEKK